MKVNRVENSRCTFGAQCILDRRVQQILKSSYPKDPGNFQKMFSNYMDKTPVLFTMTNNCKEIVAINLSNGQVYPEKVTPRYFYNLIGYLMHGRSQMHDTFWYAPQKNGCKMDFIDGTLHIRDESSLIPNRTRTVTTNGDIIYEHEYAKGYKIEFIKKQGERKLDVLSISHKDLNKPLYKDGETYYPKILKYYDDLPKFFREICKNAPKAESRFVN